MAKMNVSFSPPLISEDEIGAVAEVLRSGWIGAGPKVNEFEKKLSEYLGAPNVAAVNSGTAALHLALVASQLGPGDEVITTPMTFAATANVIEHVGAKPIFADIKRDNLNIDASQIKKKVTSKTRALMPVHVAGLPCDLDEIGEIAKAHNLITVEDAAHAFGAQYGGKMVGASGNVVCFSFYATKNITTIEGGLVCTSDPKAAELIRVLRLHGQSSDAWKRYSSGSAKSYKVTHAGYKYNMTDVQAALGIKQLEKVSKFLEARRRVAHIYLDGLKSVKGITLPIETEPKKKRVWHLFCIMIDSMDSGMKRDRVMEKLSQQGIGTGIHYEALHLQPYFMERYGFTKGMFPESEYVSEHTLSLPLSAKTTEEQADYVVDNLKMIMSGR